MTKQRIRDHLRTTYSDAELQTWFDPLRLRVSETGNIEVSFPHALYARWFSKERQKEFEREIASLFDSQPRITYAKTPCGKARSLKVSTKDFQAKAVQVVQQSPDQGQWSFDSFIYNKKNEFPVSMAREMAASAQNPAYNPFIICGRGTCGKTHLLRAMAGAMAASLTWDGIFFGTAEELRALHADNDKPGVFKRRLLRHKAIFIDNAHYLASCPGLQQELIHIVEVFREKNKPFVLALDESFDHTALNEKLRARLESGLVVMVKKPDLDVRLRYAKAQCRANRLQLRKDLLLPLAQRFQNLPAIQGMVTKIAAFQNKTDKPVSLADLEKIMANDTLTGKPATPESIINQVADTFSLTPGDITGPDRRAPIVYARQIAMYLCRELLGVSLSSLGRYFNGKNHATVIYACKKIEQNMNSDKKTHTLVTQIRKRFLSGFA